MAAGNCERDALLSQARVRAVALLKRLGEQREELVEVRAGMPAAPIGPGRFTAGLAALDRAIAAAQVTLDELDKGLQQGDGSGRVNSGRK